MKKKSHTPKHASAAPVEANTCCPFHRFLRTWYRLVRDRNSDVDRQIALLLQILQAYLDDHPKAVSGLVFDPANCQCLGLGSNAEVMAALKALGEAGVINVLQVRADDQGHIRGRELTVVSLP